MEGLALLTASGALGYCVVFVVLGIWVFVDARWRNEDGLVPAAQTMVLGWIGLSAYLLRRARVPVMVTPPLPGPVPGPGPAV